VRIPTIAVLTGPQPVDGDGLLRADLSAIGATVVEADGPAAAARAVASASAPNWPNRCRSTRWPCRTA
jgi:hypothetical protein